MFRFFFTWALLAALAYLPHSAVALDFNFSAPEYTTVTTLAQMRAAIAGNPDGYPESITVDTDGSLIVYFEDTPAGSLGGLIDVNTSTGAATFICSEADIAAATGTGVTDISTQGIAVGSNGDIFVTEVAGATDTLVRVRRTTGAPIVSLFVPITGVISLNSNSSGTLLTYCSDDDVGGNDSIRIIDIATTSVTTASTAAQIIAVSGGTEVGRATPEFLANGDIVYFDEQFRGGTDEIYRISNPGPNPTITKERALSYFGAGNDPGLVNIVADGYDNIYGWSEFVGPSGGASGPALSRLTIIPAGAGLRRDLTEGELNTAFGTTIFEPDFRGMFAADTIEDDPAKVRIYLANAGAGAIPSENIYAITYTAINPLNAAQTWESYE